MRCKPPIYPCRRGGIVDPSRRSALAGICPVLSPDQAGCVPLSGVRERRVSILDLVQPNGVLTEDEHARTINHLGAG
jgi:hypothetical protein